jgi:hypothetical protein
VCDDPTEDPTTDPTTDPTEETATPTDTTEDLSAICPPAPIDFGTDADGNTLPAGTLVNEQWSAWGVHVTAESDSSRKPDQAILFDSANPSGNDSDLGTPNEDFGGPGVGNGGEAGTAGENTEAQGMLLILPEDVNDSNGDGLVDDPNDARAGGFMTFTFDQPYRVDTVQLVDMDGGEWDNTVKVFDMDGNLIDYLNFAPLGDNSYQEARIDAMNVGQLSFELAGSGAISAIVFCEDYVAEDPTTEPTATPTEVPPTATPTEVPPTATPTEEPATAAPTEVPPTATPTEVPPTATPTEVPPTATPTEDTGGEPTPETGEPTPEPTATTPPDDYVEPTPTTTTEVSVVCYLDLSAVWVQGGTEVDPPLADMSGFEIVATSLIDSVTYTYDEGGTLVASTTSGLAVADSGESAPYTVTVNNPVPNWTTWDAGTFEASVDPYTGDCPHPMTFMYQTSGE